MDENDNKPIFSKPSGYVYQIKENAAVGDRVTPKDRKIVASDADIEENATIKFNLSGSSGEFNFLLMFPRQILELALYARP